MNLKQNKKKKCAYIPIIGKTNVGKSTIFNELIKKKISITSNKKNTTQKNIIGIYTKKNKQYIYIDTPGLKNKENTNLYIKKIINYTKKYFNIKIINLIILVIEKKINLNEIKLMNNLKNIKTPILLLINKIDKIKNKLLLLPYINYLKKKTKYISIIPISAFKKKYLKLIKNNFIKKYLTKQKHYFKLNKKTNCENKFIISEIIREKIVRLTGDEIPYSINVKIEKYNIKKINKYIFILILIKKKQHMKIIIGKNGKKIKKIIYLSKIDILKYFKINKKINLKITFKKLY